jgi:hypothetical protein
LILSTIKLLCRMEQRSVTAIIKSYMVSKGVKMAHLSYKMYGEAGKEHTAQANLSKKLRKEDLSVDLVREISIALNYNFFYDLAQDKTLPQPALTELSIDKLIDRKLDEKLRDK